MLNVLKKYTVIIGYKQEHRKLIWKVFSSHRVIALAAAAVVVD